MMNIIDRQTVVISVNLNTLTGVANPSQVNLPMNLRFVADELVLKTIVYNNSGPTADVDGIVQMWCNITNDNLIGAFPNSPTQVPVFMQLDNHFKIGNNFQNGNFILQFQSTDGMITEGPPITYENPASYNPQRLISSQTPQRTFGTLVITIEFIKNAK